MLEFKEVEQLIPDCKDYVSNSEGEKNYVPTGFILACTNRMKCANSWMCQMRENLKKVEDK